MKLKDFKPVPQCQVQITNVDRAKYPVFDFHTHMGKLLLGDDYANRYETSNYLLDLKAKNVHGIVNLDGFWGKDWSDMLEKTKGYSDSIYTFIWIDTSKIDEKDFIEKTKEHIISSYEQGAVGIKMWKNISLYQKDMHDNPIRTDDKRLDIVYDLAAQLKIPVLIHIADPTAFFEEVDEYNERIEEISANPEWSFYGDEFMSFKELMEMQENMIRSHPATNFVIAHVGSYAENLRWVSEQMDLHSNMYIDISARIAELGRVPYSAKRFFEKHQDRILFGTDCTPVSMGNLHEVTYRFLESDDEFFSYSSSDVPGQGRWNIYGLKLEDDILKKVYYKNALRLLNLSIKKWEDNFSITD